MVRCYGLIGQSEMGETGDIDKLSSVPDISNIFMWQQDLLSTVAGDGKFSFLDFDWSLYDQPTSSYDYPPNVGHPTYGGNTYRAFGPELFALTDLRDFWGEEIYAIKLALGGTYLNRTYPNKGELGACWWWPSCHKSWDITLPLSSAPFVAVTVDTGTATGVGFTTLTDATASWTVDEHRDRWVTMGGAFAHILSNTSNTLTLEVWIVPTPVAGPYVIESRSFYEASAARTYAEAYVPAAMASTGTLDYRGMMIALGENNSILREHAELAEDYMLSLIWYMRNEIFAAGATSLQAYQINWVICLVKEDSVWPHAKIVNDGYRRIARSDPHIECINTNDLPYGGLDGNDEVHFDTYGQQELGRRCAALMYEMETRTARGRASHRYFERQVICVSVWVDTSGKWYSSWTQFNALPSDKRGGAVALLLKDPGDGRIPVYLSKDGRSFSNTPADSAQGTLVGYADAARSPGMTDMASVATIAASGGKLFMGAAFAQKVDGFAWVAETDVAVDSEFTESSSSGGVDTTAWFRGVVTRMKTVVASAGIDREWLCRGGNGSFGLSGFMRIDERVGALVDQPWMQHRIQSGDYVRPQSFGRGGALLGPVVRRGSSGGGRFSARTLGIEYRPDDSSPVPVGRSLVEVSHGGSAALRQPVLWRDIEIGHDVDLNWRGIAGCHRIVLEAIAGYAIESQDDAVTMVQGCWAQATFDRQFTYDPATGAETDLSWTPATNRYHEISITQIVTRNPSGAVFSTGASPLTVDVGVIGWQATGAHGAPADGLCWGFFVSLAKPGTGASLATLGNRESVAPAGGYPQHDQLSNVHAMVDVPVHADVPAGAKIRKAYFLLTGTMAQVKAAADALYALGVDASWTE